MAEHQLFACPKRCQLFLDILFWHVWLNVGYCEVYSYSLGVSKPPVPQACFFFVFVAKSCVDYMFEIRALKIPFKTVRALYRTFAAV